MRRPRQITPGARARRALLIDVTLAAILAALALELTAGLGVVAFFGLPLLLVGLLWIGLERPVSAIRRRRQAPAR
jgi:hypothetical protein